MFVCLDHELMAQTLQCQVISQRFVISYSSKSLFHNSEYLVLARSASSMEKFYSVF